MDRPDALARVRIVLSRTSHPGNIGSAARAMKTMGLHDLRLVSPDAFPHAQATALASGAADVLERSRLFESLPLALDDATLAVGFSARPRDLSHPARNLREAAPAILEATAHGPVALVFGNETFGLTNEELGHCHWLAMIPANPDYASLNLAAAVQIACYELAVASASFTAPPPCVHAPATAAETEALYAHLETALIASGFIDPAQPKRLMERMRRLYARARLERAEVKFLRGMLAAFEKRMRG